jgi:hypothetical protein
VAAVAATAATAEAVAVTAEETAVPPTATDPYIFPTSNINFPRRTEPCL